MLVGDAGHRWPVVPLLLASVVAPLALGVFLMLRRLAGGLELPLPPLHLIATAAGLVAWTFCVQEVASTPSMTPSKRGWMKSALAIWLPLVTVLLFAVGCSYPGKRWVDWLVWGMAIVVVVLLSPPIRLRRRNQLAITTDVNSELLVQQLNRYRMPDGRDLIRGQLTAEFSPGDRSTNLYVPFCPPFETLPAIEVNVADDSSASVKVVQLLHHGAELEVRLPRTAESSQRVTVEFFVAEAEADISPGGCSRCRQFG
jgi:hypothetical protein